MNDFHHITVLKAESVEALEPKDGGRYVDATLGGGGHSELLLERCGPGGTVLGIDRDPNALAAARARLAPFGERFSAVHSTFGAMASVVDEASIDGVLADVGVSSPQLDHSERGFSFRAAGPLDMRMDPTQGETALDLIGRLDATELANIIYRYGEERRSRPIARSIKRAFEEGSLGTTDDLRRAILRGSGPQKGKQRIDPATRTFQALRIAVNGELDELERLVETAPECLVDGGIVAVISFHSLEDRIVKHAFRNDPRLEVITRRPLLAAEEEMAENPRARTAKLRVARRVVRGTEKAPEPQLPPGGW